VEITLAGERLRLLADRAAYLVAHDALLVADAHFGKAQSFRRLGVPVPGGTTEHMLQRLDALLQSTAATQLVFLGDLLHSPHALAPAIGAAVQRWRDRRPALRLTLVRGNHDRRAGDPPPGWQLRCVDEPMALGPFALRHHPAPQPGAYVLAGHLHPSVRLAGRAHQRLRLPCFHFGAEVGVLPAFGAFTGSHVLRARPGDRVYVVHGEQVRALPAG
jgi:DNA ligase-associated metallophosphoesterase